MSTTQTQSVSAGLLSSRRRLGATGRSWSLSVRITQKRCRGGHWSRDRPPGPAGSTTAAPRCASPAALGGTLSGACAQLSRSSPTSGCPSGRNGCACKNHPAPRSCSASNRRSPLRAGPAARPPTKARAPVHRLSALKLSCFENYENVLP